MEGKTARKVIRINANPLLASKRQANKQIRVAAYCRVSTDEEEQINSFNAQVAYYTEAIAKNPGWQFSGIYADEGISGTGTKNRKEFLRLMRDCEKGKIDMILTKSISRFARNTVDSLTWVRKLKTMGVGVYFEEQAIDSLKTESEMLIGLFSVIAQSESENIGANVRWGIRQSMKSGEYNTNFSCYGYKRGADGIPTIVPEEAAVVRKVFELYIDGQSVQGIINYLSDNHIKSMKGCNVWGKSAIESMLTNEKYVGDVLMQKSYVVDTISKKVKKNRGELPKYLVKNNHQAILDRETFELAQLELSKRKSERKKCESCTTEQGRYSSKFALTDLLFCGCCGSHYKRNGKTYRGKRVYYWRCIGKMEGRCRDGESIEENKLHSTICRCLTKMFTCQGKVIDLCNSNLQYAVSGDENALDAVALEEQIKDHYEKIDLLMVRSDSTEGDTKRYENEIVKLYEEISVLREELEMAKRQADSKTTVQAEMDRISKIMEKYSAESFTEFDNQTVRRLIECIEVLPDKKIIVTLRGGAKRTELIY